MKKLTILSIIAAGMGILLSLQFRSFQKVAVLVQRSSNENNLAELRVFQIANAQLRDHLEQEKKDLEDMRSKLASATVEEEIKNARLFSGEEAVSGEGIEITFRKIFKDYWLSDLVAHLVSAGAEAVAVNDVRLMSRTAGFRMIGEGILMRNTFLRPPFRIVVLGPRHELRQAIAQPGGLIDRIQKATPGLEITVTEREKLIIPALAL